MRNLSAFYMRISCNGAAPSPSVTRDADVLAAKDRGTTTPAARHHRLIFRYEIQTLASATSWCEFYGT